MEDIDSLKQYKGYLLDLDGTMYRGQEPINSAVTFVQKLAQNEIPYMFVTNNSSQTPTEVVQKLTSMNIPATAEQVMTSSIATAKYISDLDEHARCYVIGESGLTTALEAEGLTITHKNSEYVVTGIDRDINYEKLTKASLLIRAGANFISTNSDKAIPTERGLVPGNGALTSVVAVSTGVKPTFIGKPEKIIMDQALKLLGLAKNEVIMVGDNYDTDIMAGIQSNIDTLMVFTGVTPMSAYESLKIKPTYGIKNLSEWINNI
ncbi:MAG TPA: TIGR01457 family HAD-type hydrolase [Bacillota bacterium]|nr:TIGR01457 family HAD-type hydrolase [Bacillota bacterium]